jgi:hypothetical protein
MVKFAYGRSNEVASLRSATLADVNPLSTTWNYNQASRRFDRFFSSDAAVVATSWRASAAMAASAWSAATPSSA